MLCVKEEMAIKYPNVDFRIDHQFPIRTTKTYNADAALISVLNVGGSSSRDIPHFVVEYYKVRDRARGGSMCLNHPELM